MARISGIEIPSNKKIAFALTYIYGIGLFTARKILKTANVDENKKPDALTTDDISKLQNIIDRNYKVERDLRRTITSNIKRLKEIGAWRGVRLSRRLPQHGRTKTNSRTTRGNIRKTMGSGRKPTAQKT